MTIASVLLAAAAASASGAARDRPPPLTFTALSDPMPLFPGEVSNSWHRIGIPTGPIAISEFTADVVELRTSASPRVIAAVPLSDAYLHHHVVFSHSKKKDKDKDEHWWHSLPWNKHHRDHKKRNERNLMPGIEFGAGTESRGTRQKFPRPYRFVSDEGEDELVANVHVINTRAMPQNHARRCAECPCTAEDRVLSNATAAAAAAALPLKGSVLAHRRDWTRCNADLEEEENASCSPDTYRGGLLCCRHGEFCLDEYFMSEEEKLQKIDAMNASAADTNTTIAAEGRSVYYLRYTITYEPFVAEEIQPLFLADCCDASGNITSPGNIEYDIPKLCDGANNDKGEQDAASPPLPPSCIHRLETVQTIHHASSGGLATGGEGPVDEIDVVYIVGHLHRGGISMSASFLNGTSLCETLPTYGTGPAGEVGNEPGHVVAMSSCTFDPPLRMRATEGIRVVGTYDATEARTGAMSLFYVVAAAVPKSPQGGGDGFAPPKNSRLLAVAVAAIVLVSAAGWAAKRFGTVGHREDRSSYEAIPALA